MNMDKRQKVIAVFLVIAVLVLAWQVYDLFGDSSASSTSSFGTRHKLKQTSDPTAVVKPLVVAVPAVAEPAVASNAPTSAYQKQYMKLVNEYQLLQVQGMIAQQQASIARARAQTAEAMSKLNDLSADGSDLNDVGMTASASTVVSSDTNGDYELIYTGQENGQWTATLKKGGQFNDVTAGSVLPDGTKVLSVDDNGVTIVENNAKKLVTFNGVTPVAATPVATTTAATQPAAKTPVASVAPSASTTTATPKVPVVVAKPVALIPAKTATPAVSATPAAPAVSVSKPLVPKVVATNSPTTPALSITSSDKNNYTVQIIARSTEDTVNEFIQHNKLGGNALALKTKERGKLWYIGVYGDFLTVDEANKAIEGLPPSVKSEGPFVRRIGNVLKGVEQ